MVPVLGVTEKLIWEPVDGQRLNANPVKGSDDGIEAVSGFLTVELAEAWHIAHLFAQFAPWRHLGEGDFKILKTWEPAEGSSEAGGQIGKLTMDASLVIDGLVLPPRARHGLGETLATLSELMEKSGMTDVVFVHVTKVEHQLLDVRFQAVMVGDVVNVVDANAPASSRVLLSKEKIIANVGAEPVGGAKIPDRGRVAASENDPDYLDGEGFHGGCPMSLVLLPRSSLLLKV